MATPALGELAEATNDGTIRALYVCYLSLDDPLVHSQVVAYLAGLARLGHTIHLLTFETHALTRSRREALRASMEARGIAWHGLRYHKHPSLLATAFDVVSGACWSAVLIRRHRLSAFHARSHVPVAMALMVRRLAHFRLIFDIRGLMAEEYVDAGRWRRGSLPFRLTHAVQRRGVDQADAIVVLTRRVRDYLFGGPSDKTVRVIPCCADTDAIEATAARRAATRTRLGLDGRTVLIYVGKFGGWYMEREMVEFFALAREHRPELHFLVLTQSERSPIEREFARVGIDDSAWTLTRCKPSEVGHYLGAADAAIAFIRPCFSKIASSPTKVGEYLAAGLPIACIAGIGDVDELLREYRTGVGLDGWDQPALERGIDGLLELMADEDAAARARRAAKERLALTEVGIPAYDAVYRSLSTA